LKSDGTPVAVEALDVVTDAAESVGGAITGGLKDALKTGEFDFDNFRGALVSIGKRLADQLLDKAFAPIEAGISNLFSGAGGAGGGGGGFFDSIFGGLGNVFAGFFADGGTIPRGQFGIVGERGPELAFGGSGGTSIAPLGGIGAPTVQVTNHFNAGLNGADRSSIASQIQQSEERVVRTVGDVHERNPNYLGR